jgi:hypothetical protein
MDEDKKPSNSYCQYKIIITFTSYVYVKFLYRSIHEIKDRVHSIWKYIFINELNYK